MSQHDDDDDEPTHFFDWKPHNSLFPSGWKAESEETRPKPIAETDRRQSQLDLRRA
ncbi:hypothetical protein BU15DRAFT_78744 [Melanogaster broomeanus]|nr:hypothetical protein BU15DRAFT_78744 [Melanogaster broomeanus]